MKRWESVSLLLFIYLSFSQPLCGWYKSIVNACDWICNSEMYSVLFKILGTSCFNFFLLRKNCKKYSLTLFWIYYCKANNTKLLVRSCFIVIPFIPSSAVHRWHLGVKCVVCSTSAYISRRKSLYPVVLLELQRSILM